MLVTPKKWIRLVSPEAYSRARPDCPRGSRYDRPGCPKQSFVARVAERRADLEPDELLFRLAQTRTGKSSVEIRQHLGARLERLDIIERQRAKHLNPRARLTARLNGLDDGCDGAFTAPATSVSQAI